MARPLRIEYAGACYHVVNRGNMKGKVFFSSGDYETFLEKLGEFSGIFNVSVRCYCLMPNHFHLYLKTGQANLSRFMQSLLTSFCYTVNRRRRSSGHIFQGRFKSHLVEDEVYRSKLSRYIHLNPVRMEECKGLGYGERRKLLYAFKWSSLPIYSGISECPEWLDMEPVLSTWGDGEERQGNYCRYVEEGLRKGVDNPWDEVEFQSILGSKLFLQDIRRKYLLGKKVASRKEQKQLLMARGSFPTEDVERAVCKVFEVEDISTVMHRRSSLRETRKVLMYCLCKYCRSIVPISEIGRRLSVSQSGIMMSVKRVEDAILNDKMLQMKISEIERLL